MERDRFHAPVMVREVCELLQPRPGDRILDGNLGTGGHSLALLQACRERCFLVGLDLDEEMLESAQRRFEEAGIGPESYALRCADHRNLALVLKELGEDGADRILLDLGANSLHFDLPERGFSCQKDGPLDMRYCRDSGRMDAAALINEWPEEDLARLFKEKGEERWAKRIARRIVETRQEKPFGRTGELARLVEEALPRKAWPPKTHPATRIFLALRVAVNGEDEALYAALEAATEALKPGGRMAVITFQSLEDRTVKQFFRRICRDVIDEADPFGRVREAARFRDLTRKPLRASEEEKDENPRSRSALLRGVEKKPV